jgi:hypothetical protein
MSTTLTGMVFDAYQEFTLKSVYVLAQTTANRTFYLLDENEIKLRQQL